MKQLMFVCLAVVAASCLPPSDWDWNKPAGYTGTGPSVLFHGTVFGLDDAPIAGVRACDAFQCVSTDAAGHYTMQVAAAKRSDIRIWKAGFQANRYVIDLKHKTFYMSQYLLTQQQQNAAFAIGGGNDWATEGLLSIVLENYGQVVPDTSDPDALLGSGESVPGASISLSPAALGGTYLPTIPYSEGTYSIYLAAIKTGTHEMTLTLPTGIQCGVINGAARQVNGKYAIDVRAQYVNRVNFWCVN